MHTFNEKQIQEALNRPFPDYVNNLRYRNGNLQKDCYIRGVLGEIFIRDILDSYGFITKSNENNDDNTDRDLLIYGLNIRSSQILFQKEIKIEIKTSLIPYNGFDYINEGDIKIYKKTNDFKNDIYWDFGIQIYFHEYRIPWEKRIQNIYETNQNQKELLKLYSTLNFDLFWISRQNAILANSLSLDKVWHHANKVYWRCPIIKCNSNFYEFIIYLLDGIIDTQCQEISMLKNYILSNNTK
ncbi:hypothetical protein [Campylobacter sp. 1569]|uniref:hypothetical protein n=1 Tax=Campylobacter sp. 1569 TaxID=2735746 RepID=UPI00301C8747|nr:hypothetical protein [Campylobacter sp. 1569]